MCRIVKQNVSTNDASNVIIIDVRLSDIVVNVFVAALATLNVVVYDVIGRLNVVSSVVDVWRGQESNPKSNCSAISAKDLI